MARSEAPPSPLPELRARCDALAVEVAGYGPRSVPRELRRRHLLACAHVQFIEHGYDDTSMTGVAGMAAVTKPVLYEHFGSKEALFDACMADTDAELAARTAAAVRAEPDPRNHVYAAGRAYFEYVQERRPAWDRLLRAGGSPVREWELRMRDRQAADTARRLTREAEAAGTTVDEHRVEAVAHMAAGAAEALAAWWTRQPDVTLEEIAQLYADAVGPALLVALGPPLHASVRRR